METSDIQKGILDARRSAYEELKTVLDTAAGEKRGLTAEEEQTRDRIHADLDSLEARQKVLKEQTETDDALDETRTAMERFTRPEADPSPNGSEDQRAISWFRGEDRSRGFEINLAGIPAGIRRLGGDKWETRVLSEGTTFPAASGGGATVAVGFRNVLYQHLVYNSAIRQTRATVLTTDNGENLVMPKTTAHPSSGTVLPEGNTITTSDPTFGQGTLHAYKYAYLVQVSNELLTDTNVDLLGYLAMAFGRALGNGSGRDYVTGTGTSQPQGFLVGAGTVGKITGGTGQSGAPTGNEVFDTYHSIIPPYRQNAEWFMSDNALKLIRELKSTTGQYLWTPGGLAGGVPNTLLDKPYVVDPNMANTATNATSIAFGDFSAYFIRDVGSLRFERSDDFAFNTDLVTFRCILRTDGLMLDASGAIGYYVGGTA